MTDLNSKQINEAMYAYIDLLSDLWNQNKSMTPVSKTTAMVNFACLFINEMQGREKNAAMLHFAQQLEQLVANYDR